MYTAQNYHFATSLSDAYEMLAKNPQNCVVAGNTWLRLSRRRINTLIDISRLGLDKIEESPNAIILGGGAPLRMVEEHPALQVLFSGVLPKSVAPIVGVQLRNAATVGAHVALKHGFSDFLTALLALDTTVCFYKSGEVPLDEYLLEKHPRKDIVTAVRIEKDGRIAELQAHRSTKADFATLTACAAKTPAGVYTVTVGARPMVAVRCAAAAGLAGQNPAAAGAAAQQLNFAGNMRASSAYRKLLAGALVRRAVEELNVAAEKCSFEENANESLCKNNAPGVQNEG